MERAWSVEDLVGGLWRISRTESDQQLQDYLRRGPYPGQQNQTPEQFQQAQAAAQAAAIAAGPHAQAAYAQAQAQAQAAQGMQQAMQAMAAGKAGELVHDRGQNMQRVASLDMLRALVMQNPGQMQLSPGQAQGGMNAPPGPPGVGARGGHPSPGGHPKGMPSRPGHLQPNAVGVGVGSNPMQLNGSGSAAGQKGRNGGQQPILDKNMDKTEVRRVRRMLSNRESARRSRRRKQEHLSTLEDRLKISEQNRIVMEEKIKILISDNKRLLEENKALQETLKQQTTSNNNSNGSPVVVAPTKEQGDSPNTNGSPNGFHPRANGSPSKNESQSQGGSPGAKVKREGGEEPAPNSKRVRTEDKEEEANLKRTSSMQEFSNRLKGENEAGACTLQTAHRESWQDLSAAEQHQSVH